MTKRITPFLICIAIFFYQLVNAQYTHPTTGQQSTFIGACPVNLCSGTYTDNGGSGGNYAANINGIIRTFCAENPDEQLRVAFTSFSMNDTYFLCFGPGSCCDYLQIFDGPTIQSPMIYNNCTSSPGTVTSSSGCLTFRFYTDGSVQLAGWSAQLSCVAGPGGQASGTNSDCMNASSLFTSGPVSDTSTGPGLVSEGCAGCILGEHYSSWHSVCISTSGTLAFTITPLNSSVDYDFAVYGPNVSCGTLGTPLRCSWAAASGSGSTGTGNGAIDNSEDVGGDQWVAPLDVIAGESYYILINRITNTPPGFNFTFTGTAVIADCNTEDQTDPVFDCNTLTTINVNTAMDSCNAIVNLIAPVATDNVDGTVTATGVRSDALALTDPYPIGTTTITWTFQDMAGNSIQCMQDVVVTDNLPPTIACPGSQLIVLGENCSATLPDYSVLGISDDNCVVQSITQSPLAGTTVSAAGNMSIILSVIDENDNTNSCTFTATKVDNTAPAITCPISQTLILDPGCNATIPDYTGLATANDNCGVQSITQSPVVATTVSAAGNMSIILSVTDVNSNTNSCTFTAMKVDNTAPTITCPISQTLTLDPDCNATLSDYTELATAIDNCSIQSITQSPLAGTMDSGAGNMTVNLTVTDSNGLSNTCQFTVSKVDNTFPILQCSNQNVNFNGEEEFALNATELVQVSDNCDLQSVVLNPTVVTPAQIGQSVLYTATVTDENGNSSTCSGNINVNGLPAGWAQNINGINCAGGNIAGYNSGNEVWTVSSTNCYYNSPFTSDAMAFAQKTLCGNGSITAQVTGISGTSLGWAGLVMRENNTGGSKKSPANDKHSKQFLPARNTKYHKWTVSPATISGF
ncbi:MAG: HYR domain-containing protein [Saprospiraceae bacterium]|nr:HYR domain-containing protein [Saprospiraceae bacterium]